MPRPKKISVFESQIHAIVARAAAEIAAATRREIASEVQKAIGAPAVGAARPRAVADAAQVAPPKSKGGRPTKASKRAAVDGLLKFVAEHPGLRSEEIVKQVGGNGDRIKAGLATLFAQGKVKRAGKARGTRYTAVAAAPPESAAASAEPAAAAPGKAKPAAAKRPTPTTKPAAKRPAQRRGGWKRRLITDAELKVVLDVLAKKPGLTSVEIQKAAGIDSKEAGRVLSKLRETKKVEWKGERSAATYTVA